MNEQTEQCHNLFLYFVMIEKQITIDIHQLVFI